MFSLETMYQVFGEPWWADLVEQMAYNALPASNTPDFWQHQYLQQTNQIWAKDHTDGFPWQFQNVDDSYSNVFGLESYVFRGCHLRYKLIGYFDLLGTILVALSIIRRVISLFSYVAKWSTYIVGRIS